MMQKQQFKHILCIRADNMGDVIMTTPCFRALKDTYHCRITLLTSQMGSKITPFIAEIDETIVADVPWVKTPQCLQEHDLLKLIRTLRNYHFSAAIIFSVYSQNTLPAAMLAYMAGIPVRLAYCRENPYELLTHWKVDKEPYEYILHQVERDLDLVRFIGASTKNETLHLTFSPKAREKALKKLSASGINTQGRWLILHAGVSEEKRCYPMDR